MGADLSSVKLDLVQTTDDAMRMMRWLGERHESDVIGFDLETGELPGRPTGDALSPWHGRIRLAQIGDEHQGWAVAWDEWAGLIYEILEKWRGDLLIHNAAFEAKWMALQSRWDFPWHKVHDTMIAAQVINPAESAALKTLTSKYVDSRAAAMQSTLDVTMTKAGWTWGSVPVAFGPYWQYAALDPVLTVHLWATQRDKVTGSGPYARAYDLEMGARRVATMMELNGARVDLDYCHSKYDELHEFGEKSRGWVKDVHGISIGSNVQLARTFLDMGVEWPEDAFTATGQPKVDKDQLTRIKINYPGPAEQLADVVLKQRKADKLATTYFQNLIERNIDGIVHPQIRTMGARTGRMCLAAGTMIDGPRDLIAHPNGVPIENIKPGDLVYSFDDSGTPHVKKVLLTHEKGVKRVMRLIYAARGVSGGRKLMELKATPDHRIALHTGEYRELKDLRPGDKLGFLHRTVLVGETGYATSKIAWNGDRARSEARYVYHDCGGDADKRLIHHANGNSLDQRPENLSGLANRAEHASIHYGPGDCPYTRDELIELVSTDTNLKRISAKIGVGFRSLKKWMELLDVPPPSNSPGPYGNQYSVCPLTASEFFTQLEKHGRGKRGGIESLAVEMCVPSSVVRRWKREFTAENHVVVAVVDDGEYVPVYDLTIEDTPNFVANELWVHNSIADPALQTLPKGEAVVRRAFIAKDDDHAIVTSDLDQVEFRMFTNLTSDPKLVQLFKDSDADTDPLTGDAFTWIMREIYNDPSANKKDKRRKLVKSYIYGRLYGAGVAKQALTAGIPEAQMKAIADAFDSNYPGVGAFTRQIEDLGMRRLREEGEGYVKTQYGRRLPCDEGRVYTLVNYLIQGSAAEVFKNNLLKMDAEGLTQYMIVPVHDEIVTQVPKTELADVMPVIKDCMTTTEGYDVPLTSGIDGPFQNWGEGIE